MDYSPKLKRIMTQIQDILIKEDVAGFVALHEIEKENKNQVEGISEYMYHLNPSYSCVKPEGVGMRISAMDKDFDGDRVKKSAIIASTANMLVHLKTISKMVYQNIERMSYTIDNLVEAEHIDEKHTPNIGNLN